MDEIKIVITIKGDKGLVGIQSPNCDPVISIHKGDLQSLLGAVPAMVEEAKKRWGSNPRYPKSDFKPEPPPSPKSTEQPSTPQKTNTIQPELQLF